MEYQTHIYQDNTNKKFNSTKLSIYSAIGTMIADFLVYPFDTVATRLKLDTKQFGNFKSEFLKILRSEKVSNFYRGSNTIFYTSGLPQFVFIIIYENLNKFAIENSDQKKLKYLFPLISAPIAEFAAMGFYLPFDIIRTRLQANTKEYQYKSVMQGLNHISNNEGIFRLFKAAHLHFINYTILITVQVWLYEILRSYRILHSSRQNQNKGLTFSESVVCSLISSSLATIAANPVDIIFTRFQIINSQKQKLQTLKIIKQLIYNEGYKSFFKGCGSKIIFQGTFGAMWLPIYEYFKKEYGVSLHD